VRYLEGRQAVEGEGAALLVLLVVDVPGGIQLKERVPNVAQHLAAHKTQQVKQIISLLRIRHSNYHGKPQYQRKFLNF
jgi:hypothetical protein